jgi:hypothetical protein
MQNHLPQPMKTHQKMQKHPHLRPMLNHRQTTPTPSRHQQTQKNRQTTPTPSRRQQTQKNRQFQTKTRQMQRLRWPPAHRVLLLLQRRTLY